LPDKIQRKRSEAEVARQDLAPGMEIKVWCHHKENTRLMAWGGFLRSTPGSCQFVTATDVVYFKLEDVLNF
jgi:hypothetical protein